MREFYYNLPGSVCHSRLQSVLAPTTQPGMPFSQGSAIHAIVQVQPMGPQVLDLNVPAPPSLDGHIDMTLLEFPEVEEIPEETPAVQQKQEFRRRLGPGFRKKLSPRLS